MDVYDPPFHHMPSLGEPQHHRWTQTCSPPAVKRQTACEGLNVADPAAYVPAQLSLA